MDAAKNLAERPVISYQEVLARDSRPAPEILREHTVDLGTAPIAASRYTSQEFFDREVEKVFLKTWQYACREEDIPKPGDSLIFDLVGKSIIIVRQADGSIKALQNVCLHRGRKLLTRGGCQKQFRCPYHGLAWNTDGTFLDNPFGWDFPQLSSDKFSLPEIRLETWAGFVFVNFDRESRPLLQQLAPIPEHFDHWRIHDCYRSAFVGKLAPANWKVCVEAFLESHHVFATHPQLNPFNGFESGQYDVLSDNVTRFMNPSGLINSLYYDQSTENAEERMIDAMFSIGSRAGTTRLIEPSPGITARQYAAQVSRLALEQDTGYDFSDACDAEVVDGISYDFFPNFHIWGGYKDKICYRFRPVGLNHELTLIEVMLYKIAPKDKPKPPPAPFHMLGEVEPWLNAKELGTLSGIYDQDQSNMEPVQAGLRAIGEGDIQFSKYLEVRCRHLHHMIDVYMSR